MGRDVYGVEPYTEAGKYFRANVWSWRPLWEYVCDVCNIDEETRDRGHYNDGHRIEEDAATSMGLVLQSLLKSGLVQKYADHRKKELAALPDEQCTHCNGTGQRDDEYVQGTCNGCDGKGTVRPFETHYSFKVEWVEEFAEFARQSGGFEIY